MMHCKKQTNFKNDNIEKEVQAHTDKNLRLRESNEQ